MALPRPESFQNSVPDLLGTISTSRVGASLYFDPAATHRARILPATREHLYHDLGCAVDGTGNERHLGTGEPVTAARAATGVTENLQECIATAKADRRGAHLVSRQERSLAASRARK